MMTLTATIGRKKIFLITSIFFVIILTFLLHSYSQIFIRVLHNSGVLFVEKPVTELYFTDYNKLPSIINPLEDQSFGFGVHNFEGKKTKYTFRVITIRDNEQTEMRSGTFELEHGKKRELRVPITFPDTDTKVGSSSGATRIEVRLDGKKPVIHFWMRSATITPTP